jgi:hypothetical protein
LQQLTLCVELRLLSFELPLLVIDDPLKLLHLPDILRERRHCK